MLVVRARVPLAASRLWGCGRRAAELVGMLGGSMREGAQRAIIDRLRTGMAMQLNGATAGTAAEWAAAWSGRAHEVGCPYSLLNAAGQFRE